MQKFQKFKKRSISYEQIGNWYIPTVRKRVKRVHGSKDKNKKQRIIFKEIKQIKENQGEESKMPKIGILHSIKNLNFFGIKNQKVLVGNPLYCHEKINPQYLPTIENSSIYANDGNKSFDDIQQAVRRKKKVKRIVHAAQNRIIKTENKLISRGSMKLFDKYGMRLLKTLLEKEENIPNPLANHEITISMRARMVDWMIEVFAIYRKNEDTYFQAVYLLDKYLASCDSILDDTHVHLIGVSCMFSASKYLDYEGICMKEIWESISHGVFKAKNILKTENAIFQALDYEYDIVTPFHFITTIMMLVKKEVWYEESKHLYNTLELAAFQYAKMTLINADFCHYKPSEIAFGALSNACNYLINDKFAQDRSIIKQIVVLFQVLFQKSVFKTIDIDSIEDSISNHLKNFDSEFPACFNAHKFSLISN